jgi:hypothetical protein
VYERKKDKQVFYVLPVENILGKLPVVPVGDTGTIPRTLLMQHLIQRRVLVTEAAGGISTRGP